MYYNKSAFFRIHKRVFAREMSDDYISHIFIL